MIEISYFLLFVALMSSLLTYAIIPRLPIIALISAASIVLAAGVWWHWMQFAVDYKNNTWMEQLRNYSPYVLVFFVILFSYGYYTLAFTSTASEPSEPSIASSVIEQSQEIGSQIMSAPSAVLETLGNLLDDEGENEGRGRNANANANRELNANGDRNRNMNRNRNRNNNFLI